MTPIGPGRIVVAGSLTYDFIMSFDGRFVERLLPDKLHALSASFVVSRIRREYGGNAGNIAYNLRLLGETPTVVSSVGNDFAPYAKQMKQWGIETDNLKHFPDEQTAQVFIVTDTDNNHIHLFHPGAVNFSHLNTIGDVAGISLGIVAPSSRDGIIHHANRLAALSVPFLFDPGPCAPLFSREDLETIAGQARWMALNEYEWQVIQNTTRWTSADVLSRMEALILTFGPRGSLIHTRDAVIQIPPATPAAVVDPTGCGDAYRAGILHGLLHGLDWQTTGRIASVMGAIKIEHAGSQNHSFTRDEFVRRLSEPAWLTGRAP